MENELMIACVACYIAEFSNVPQTVRYHLGLKRLKPFDCEHCLAFWLTVIYMATQPDHFDIIDITKPFLSSVISIFIIKLAKR